MNGITSCENCGRIFDSSDRNKLLSAAWMVRREHLCDLDLIRFRCKLSEDDIAFIYQYVVDDGCCHDEFVKVLNARIDNAA